MFLCLRTLIRSQNKFCASHGFRQLSTTRMTPFIFQQHFSNFRCMNNANIICLKDKNTEFLMPFKITLPTSDTNSSICLQISIRHKSFDFTKKDPVKHANDWTKWKRKAIKYQTTAERNKSTLLYLLSLAILTAGASYAAVPLYRAFCQASGYGGTSQVGHDVDKVEKMEPQKERLQ